MKPAKIAEIVVLVGFGMLIMAVIQTNLARSQAPFPCPTLPEVPVRVVTATGSAAQSVQLGDAGAVVETTQLGETASAGETALPGETIQPDAATQPGEAIQPAVASTSEPTLTRGAVTVWPAITLPPSVTPTLSASTSTPTPPVSTLRPLSTGPGITRVEPPVEAETGETLVNVRVLPGTNAALLMTLQPGTPVTIFERTQVDGQTWAHVILGGQVEEGWIFEELLTVPNSRAP